MAVFYLRHHVHGVKVAISDLEVAHDEELGWELFTPGEVTPSMDNAIVRRRTRKLKVDDEEAVNPSHITDLD